MQARTTMPPGPHLLAAISLLPAGRGGRTTAIPAGEFRTVIGEPTDYFSAALFPETELVPGGPAVTCGVVFLIPDTAVPLFPIGRKFELWEGGTKGHGEVLTISET